MRSNHTELHALSRSATLGPRLASGVYAIVDADTLGWPSAPDETQLADVVAQSAAFTLAVRQAGAAAVQLRYKAANAATRTACALAMIRAAAQSVPVVVNDDMAVALAVGAGLHLGQSDGDVAVARRTLGDRALLGWSTHRLADVDRASRLPVDYLGFGPVRPTLSKRNAEPVTGWAQLADACARTVVPVVAIGGMQWQDAAIARSAGAHGMAVISAWLRDGDRAHSPTQARDALARIAQAWQAG